MHARFTEHSREWALDTLGERTDEHGQAVIEVQLLRVTAELADWADTLPDGILTLLPSLTPHPATRPVP
jgi:phage tail protein X